MTQNLKFLDIYLRSEGPEMLFLTALWLFISLMSVGISIMVSWPAMVIFYGALFEIIF